MSRLEKAIGANFPNENYSLQLTETGISVTGSYGMITSFDLLLDEAWENTRHAIMFGLNCSISLVSMDYGSSCNEGGSGGGNNGSGVTTEVFNNLISPCFSQMVNTIGNPKLKSFISDLYNQTFVGNNF